MGWHSQYTSLFAATGLAFDTAFDDIDDSFSYARLISATFQAISDAEFSAATFDIRPGQFALPHRGRSS